MHEQTPVEAVEFSANEVTLSYKSVDANEVGSARCADRTSQRDVPTTQGEIQARARRYGRVCLAGGISIAIAMLIIQRLPSIRKQSPTGFPSINMSAEWSTPFCT